jgi:hypothetical protein
MEPRNDNVVNFLSFFIFIASYIPELELKKPVTGKSQWVSQNRSPNESLLSPHKGARKERILRQKPFR